MRGATIACLFGLLPFLGGCSVTRQMEQNLTYEEKLWTQDTKLVRKMEKEANELLREICHRHPHKVFTVDFREGFLDGYKDFLVYGGPIRPPAMPALKYRNAFYLSPEGHAQVRDWFLGFQYGSECAQSTGRRQYYTLPVLVTDQAPLPPLNIEVIPPPPEGLSTDDPKKKETPAAKPEAPAPPKPEVPKADPPKADPPKADPPKAEIPKAMPAPAPKAEPAPKPTTTLPEAAPVPTVPAVTPPPIPLIPMLPSVSFAPAAAPAVVPASAILTVPNTP